MQIDRSFKLLAISSLLAGAAAAQVQNSDVAILIGPVPSSHQNVSAEIPAGQSFLSLSGGEAGSVSQSAGVSFLVSFAYQLHASKIADLYVDLPVAWKFAGTATVAQNSVAALSNNTFYFTPGVRVKFNVHPRLGLFVVGGVGVGTAVDYVAQVENGSVFVTENRANKLVGEAGAGLDFRLTKLLSLRVEEREFFRASQASGIFGVGLGFHF